MDLVQGLMLVTVVHLLAAASPGPDFVMVTQQTLMNGRGAGFSCSLGIALGLSVHIAYSALGMATVIANSAFILTIVKVLGGCYLLYLGLKGIRARRQDNILSSEEGEVLTISPWRSVARGFLCNVLNPKAPLYFVSLFTVVLSPAMPLEHLLVYGIWIMVLQFCWFAFVTLVFASPPVSAKFSRYGHYVDRVLGGALILLGLKVLTSRT